VIVVDTSALYAIAFEEPEAAAFVQAILTAERAVIGAPTAFELQLVTVKRAGAGYLPVIQALLATAPIEIIAWSPDLVTVATDALRRFGGRPASLNYGDCMAYALAKSLNAPLLYKGGDFAATDVRSAI
jgi:ribonuclease VapC